MKKEIEEEIEWEGFYAGEDIYCGDYICRKGNLFFRCRAKKKYPKCLNCGRKLNPDKKAVIFGTKKWDGHSYFACECSGKSHKNYRILVG